MLSFALVPEGHEVRFEDWAFKPRSGTASGTCSTDGGGASGSGFTAIPPAGIHMTRDQVGGAPAPHGVRFGAYSVAGTRIQVPAQIGPKLAGCLIPGFRLYHTADDSVVSQFASGTRIQRLERWSGQHRFTNDRGGLEFYENEQASVSITRSARLNISEALVPTVTPSSTGAAGQQYATSLFSWATSGNCRRLTSSTRQTVCELVRGRDTSGGVEPNDGTPAGPVTCARIGSALDGRVIRGVGWWSRCPNDAVSCDGSELEIVSAGAADCVEIDVDDDGNVVLSGLTEETTRLPDPSDPAPDPEPTGGGGGLTQDMLESGLRNVLGAIGQPEATEHDNTIQNIIGFTCGVLGSQGLGSRSRSRARSRIRSASARRSARRGFRR